MDKVAVWSIFLRVLLLTAHILAEKSTAECFNQSGEVVYDPKTKTCICDRSKGFIERGLAEQCIHLGFSCAPGRELNKKETDCVPCKHGWYKSVDGLDWCIEWTVCKESEWTMFSGNATADRTCTATKPEVLENTSPNYHIMTSSSTSVKPQKVTPVQTSPVDIEPMKESKRSGGGITSDLLYIFFGVCGAIFWLAVVCSELIKKIACLNRNDSSEEYRNVEEGRTETEQEKLVDKTPIQIDVRYVEEDEPSAGQEVVRVCQPQDDEPSAAQRLLSGQNSQERDSHETGRKTVTSERNSGWSNLGWSTLLSTKQSTK
ncbi:uncharacterized protein LOC117315976 [Pecten maximus]|uniref:uncharacterized protein LOC117315976 n=1 Tax=Pecten maximus TaxID=6579 RepID=UPI00145812E8|nr:uncharacterized protein LOC117315976 [Pecten maximus]